MDAEALTAKLRELLVGDPSLGYRTLHARLKEEPQFSGVALKKVQSALQRIREEQPVGVVPKLEREAPREQHGSQEKKQAALDKPQLPGAPVASEVARRASCGAYSEIVQGRLKLVDIAGKGKGYVAARPISQGEVLLFDVAFCSSPSGPLEYSDMAAQCKAKQGTAFFEQEVMSLTSDIGGGLLGILRNNVFTCVRDPDHTSLFVGASRFNHSCCPNAVIDSTRSQAVVRALQNIAEGEEVCLSYVPPGECLSERQDKLSGKLFRCTCERCEEEEFNDPQLLVPCRCGQSRFTIKDGAPRQQVCEACSSAFDAVASARNLRKMEDANTYMRSHGAAQADPRELVKRLRPLAEMLEPGTVNGPPPTNMTSLQLLNNLANCHYFVATRIPGPHRKASLAAFLDCKERFMSAYEANHGKTNQRDLNFLHSLHRILMGEFSSKAEQKVWERKMADTCKLHFGQSDPPAGVIASVRG